MRHALLKTLSLLAVTGLGAAVVAGCGNDVPANAVAKVGDAVITQDEFNKWFKTASASQAQGGDAAPAPDPPDFERCIAAKKKQPLPKGQKQPTDSQLKKQCQQEFDQLKTEVMQFLIQAEWVQQEAEAQGIQVSDKEVERSFEDQKKQAFPNDKAYQQFLKSSGMTEEDILFRVRLDQLQQELTQKVTKDAQKVTDQDVEAYYDKNKERFAQPERRDLRVVLTKTKAKAEQAKRALDEAVFAARKGQIEGPVKTQFGWYVFEVEKITPASQQTLEESKETIRNLLRSQGQQKALDDFIKEFRENYKDDTECPTTIGWPSAVTRRRSRPRPVRRRAARRTGNRRARRLRSSSRSSSSRRAVVS